MQRKDGLPKKSGGPRRHNCIGEKFGFVTILAFVELRYGVSYWRMRCDCGKEFVGQKKKNASKIGRSCGCMNKVSVIATHRRHGMSETNTYRAWQKMRERCVSVRSKSFPDYGGRGISVCQRWQTFDNFLADMGPCPPRMSIERIDNDGNYESGNCRWATLAEQARNKRRTVRLVLNGKAMCLSEAARVTGLDPSTVQRRLRRGWTPEQAVFCPSRRGNAGRLPCSLG